MGRTKELLDNIYFQIFLVIVFAGFFRALPLLEYTAWGHDFGIYYGLTNSFIETKKLFLPYSGWGTSYQYFPNLYIITAGIHELTGWKVSTVLAWMGPIFGTLTVFFIFGIAKKHLPEKLRYVALLSGLILAVNSLHLYQTSKSSPFILGHFSIAVLFYLYIISFEKKSSYYLMFPMGLFLVTSHHLSTYIFIISFFVAAVARNILEDWDDDRARMEFSFLGYITGITFLYWYVVVIPLKNWVGDFFHMPLPLLTVITFIIISSVYLLLKKKHELFNSKAKWFLDETKDIPDSYLLILSTVLMGVVLILLGVYGMGPVDVSLNPVVFIIAIPTILVLGFGVMGLKYLRDYPIILGWFLAILISLGFATATWSRTLYPERHLEYLIEPMSISAALAIWVFVRKYYTHDLSRPWKQRRGSTEELNVRKMVPVVLVALIVCSGFISTPRSVSGDVTLGVTNADMRSMDFFQGNTSINYTVATDHRLGNLVNGTYGHPSTFERARDIWTSCELSDYIHELDGNQSQYPRIGYVLVDDVMLNDSLVVVDNGPHGSVVVIYDWCYEKFSREPFELIYRIESDGGSHWVEVYEVNWTFVEEAREVG